jgi:hypothetical protein
MNSVRTAILSELVAPLARRVGSIGAGAIAALGATDSALLVELQAGLAAAVLIGADLLVSHLSRVKAR